MKTLYNKYILFTIFMFLISTLISLLITNAIYHQVMKEKNDDNYLSRITDITHYIETYPPDDLDAYFTHLGEIGYQIYLVDEQKNDHFYGGEYRLKQIEDRTVDTVLQGEMYHGIREYPRKLFITGFFSNDLNNSVGKSFEYNGKTYAMFIRLNIKLLFSEMHFIIGGLFAFILIVSIVVSVAATWYILRPIKRLSEATKLVAEENFDAHIDSNRADEIGQLSRNFNRMTEELKNQREARKNFIRNVSHDFQTPLQSINGYAHLITNDKDVNKQIATYGAIILEESDKLSHLTKQLLLWQNATKLAEKKEKLRLDEIIRQVVADRQFAIQQKNMSVWMELEPLEMMGSELYLVHVVENLLNNALKYSETGTEISFIGKNHETSIELIIEDEGIGITEEQLQYIFEPFYRADDSRTTEGTGLGLVIVKQILDMHDGSITVSSIKGEGTQFILRFPK